MAISDKITSIQDHLKDDWDSVESLIGDTELDKNIENISSALDDLYNDLPKVTGSGTSITLDDTRKGRLESTLSGNTYQTQYSGKNLLPPTIATETKNGITLTNNGDGSYTLTGTYSTSTTFDMALPATLNGTYSFSGNNPTAGKNIQFRISASSGSSLSTYLNNVNKTVENKTIENGTKQSIRIVGSFTSGFTFKPQLESGSTATSYEPYLGGVGTPNPTNPADVNVVSGDNEVHIDTKNKISFKNLTNSTLKGIDVTYNNSEVKLNGTTTSSGNIIPVGTNLQLSIPAGTYTFSLRVKSGSNSGIGGGKDMAIYLTKSSGSSTSDWLASMTISQINNGSGVKSATFTTETPVNLYIYTYANNSGITFENYTLEAQIEEGNSMTSYVPYDGDTYNIDLGVENLWDTSKLQSGYLNQSGSYPTTNPSFPNACYRLVYLYKGQSITTYRSTSYGDFRMRYIDVDTNLIVGTVGIGDNGGYCSSKVTYQGSFNNGTITALKDVILGLFDYGGNMAAATITYGTKIQAISPTPIELCKIGNYQDKFIRTSGKNLFDKNTITSGYRLDGSGIPNGSASNEFTSDFIEVESGKTYIRNYGSVSAYTRTCFYDKNKSFVSKNDDSQSITIPDNVKYIRFSEYLSRLDTMQLEKGTTITEYQPYGVGKWYLHKEIGKVVLNGTQAGARRETNTNNYYRFTITVDNVLRVANSDTKGAIVCDKFVTNTLANTYMLIQGINAGLTSSDYYRDICIYCEAAKTWTWDEFKTWLASNNVTLYYALATPTNELIEYQPLIDQLNLLEKAMSKDGQTNISQINNDLGFIISASALKKGDTIENNSTSLLMSFGGLPNTNGEEETSDFEEDVSDVEEETPIEESIEEETPIEESIEEETDEEPIEEETEIEEEEEQ